MIVPISVNGSCRLICEGLSLVPQLCTITCAESKYFIVGTPITFIQKSLLVFPDSGGARCHFLIILISPIYVYIN